MVYTSKKKKIFLIGIGRLVNLKFNITPLFHENNLKEKGNILKQQRITRPWAVAHTYKMVLLRKK